METVNSRTKTARAARALLAAFLIPAPGAAAGEYDEMARNFARSAVRNGVKKIAVVEFALKGTASREEAQYAAEKLSGRLSATKKVDVIERALLGKIADEQKLRSAFGPDEEPAGNLARMLRVDAIITGMVFATDGRLKTIFKLITLDSGKVLETGEVETEREPAAWPAPPGPEAGEPESYERPPGFHDAVLAFFGAGTCADELKEIDRLNSIAVALKAKYWSARGRIPALSGSKPGKTPGAELRNPETKRLFRRILDSFNGLDDLPELTLGEMAALETIWNLEKSVSDKCGGGRS